jgi:hypothetical protein
MRSEPKENFHVIVPVFVLNKNKRLLIVWLLFLVMLSGCGGGGKSSGNIPPANAAVLVWVAPETNVDGTPLTDLAGYKIYYGRSAGSYTDTVTIPVESASCVESENTTQCSYTVGGLGSGIYYFVVTAYDLSGDESVYSNEASKDFK